MQIKERLENNLVWFALTLSVSSFCVGIGAYKFVAEMTASKPESTAAACPQAETDWAVLARKAEWLPRADCPAYPVSISISSPGNGSVVSFDTYYPYTAYTDFVIKTSRPLPRNNSVGLIVNQPTQLNYYVLFPSFTVNDTRTVFRLRSLNLPFSPESDRLLNYWALIVADETQFGSIYSSLEQVRSSSTEVTLSEKTSVTVAKAR
jgi:hypothetical protein